MFCKNCGKEIDDDSKFCKFCGTDLYTEKQTIQIFNKVSSILTKVNMGKININELISVLVKEGIIPNNPTSIKSCGIYCTEIIFITNGIINPEIQNKDILSILNELNEDTIYVYYDMPRNNYDNYMDMVCLYGCPNSKKIKDKEKIEAFSIKNEVKK